MRRHLRTGSATELTNEPSGQSRHALRRSARLFRPASFLWALLLLTPGALWASPEEEATPEKPPQELSVIVGEQSGLGGRYWFSQTQALEVRTELGLFPVQSVMLRASYLISFAQLGLSNGRSLPLYFGGGLKAGIPIEDPAFIFGFSAPLGASVPLGESQAAAYLELAPGALFVDGAFAIDLDAGIGIRYSLKPKAPKTPAKEPETKPKK